MSVQMPIRYHRPSLSRFPHSQFLLFNFEAHLRFFISTQWFAPESSVGSCSGSFLVFETSVCLGQGRNSNTCLNFYQDDWYRILLPHLRALKSLLVLFGSLLVKSEQEGFKKVELPYSFDIFRCKIVYELCVCLTIIS